MRSGSKRIPNDEASGPRPPPLLEDLLEARSALTLDTFMRQGGRYAFFFPFAGGANPRRRVFSVTFTGIRNWSR